MVHLNLEPAPPAHGVVSVIGGELNLAVTTLNIALLVVQILTIPGDVTGNAQGVAGRSVSAAMQSP